MELEYTILRALLEGLHDDAVLAATDMSDERLRALKAGGMALIDTCDKALWRHEHERRGARDPHEHQEAEAAESYRRADRDQWGG